MNIVKSPPLCYRAASMINMLVMAKKGWQRMSQLEIKDLYVNIEDKEK